MAFGRRHPQKPFLPGAPSPILALLSSAARPKPWNPRKSGTLASASSGEAFSQLLLSQASVSSSLLPQAFTAFGRRHPQKPFLPGAPSPILARPISHRAVTWGFAPLALPVSP